MTLPATATDTLAPHAQYPALHDGQSFKVIDLGGIGQFFAQLLVRFLDATGRRVRVVLIDGDDYSDADGNRSRMQTTIAGTRHTNKALVTREILVPIFPGSAVSIQAVPEYLRPDNIDRLIAEGDIVCLCVDNNRTRKLLFELAGRAPEASRRRNLIIVSGGNDGVGLDSQGIMRHGQYGSVSILILRDGNALCANALDIHPEIADPTDAAPYSQSCTQALSSQPQILFMNATVAAAIANTVLLILQNQLRYTELAIDIGKGRMAPPTPDTTQTSELSPDPIAPRIGHAERPRVEV